jgi:hypothetical protein
MALFIMLGALSTEVETRAQFCRGAGRDQVFIL